MTVDIVCGWCNKKIGTAKMLKSIKNIAGIKNGRCPSCGHMVSVSDFDIDADRE